MNDWPHAPSHRVIPSGTYIVTAATYLKAPFFGSRKRLDLLHSLLLELCRKHAWNLQAWAIFPNHYHFVAESTSPGTLLGLMRHFHSLSSRAVNDLDKQSGRKVWFQYWDTLITNQRSYLARLRYVHENAMRHGVVRCAANYPWCSAAWFERKATPAFRKTVLRFPCDRVSVPDGFEVVVKL